jgi:hypothetical protein
VHVQREYGQRYCSGVADLSSDAAVAALGERYVAYEWVATDQEGSVKHQRVLDARRGKALTDVQDAHTGSNTLQPRSRGASATLHSP